MRIDPEYEDEVANQKHISSKAAREGQFYCVKETKIRSLPRPKSLLAMKSNLNMMQVENEFEKLNERKKYYAVVDDDTIQSLIRYYRLEQDQHKAVIKFAKNTAMKGDTFD